MIVPIKEGDKFMKHKGRMLGLLIVLVILAAAIACQAATVTVEPGQRIQAAIDSARPATSSE